MYDVIIVGAGIVGLSVAMQLSQRYPKKRVLVLDKEDQLAFHQTGHNSGVIHSGLYYQPGSLKAKLCTAGAKDMVTFCQKYGIAHDICGKVVVATKPEELPRLQALLKRGLENGVPVREISLDELKEIEPNIQAIAALYVSSTGIVDYVQVCEQYAKLAREQGVEIQLGCEVKDIIEFKDGVAVETNRDNYQAKFLITCAGLQSDRMAKMAGADPGLKIVPFRGEYYDIVSDKKSLVNHLVYPVPDPNFPFLGVHLTRRMDGRMSIGPNAVLNFSREGYRKWQVNLPELFEVLTYRGFLKLSGKYIVPGGKEMLQSWFKGLFLKQVQAYLPQIERSDIAVSPCGIRAQALAKDGSLLQDFHLVTGPYQKSLHVCNAPSPAATSSLGIGEMILSEVEKLNQ